MQFLVSTPLRLFVFDAASGTIDDVVVGGRGYFGFTWHDDTFFLSQPLTGLALATHGGGRRRPGGDVVALSSAGRVGATPARLDDQHQIEWADGSLVVVDTGFNRISTYGADLELERDVLLGSERLDRGPDGDVGHHFNGAHRAGDRLWVVAHNFDRPSEVWELTWPGLEVVTVHRTTARWAHNTWVRDDRVVICDSERGALHEVRTGETLWRSPEPEVLTRGLACVDGVLAVGRSAFSGRPDRVHGTGGIWLFDAETLELLETFVFPGSGAVHELRAMGPGDECHNREPAPLAAIARLREDPGLVGASPARPEHRTPAPVRRDARTGRDDHRRVGDRSVAGVVAELRREAVSMRRRVADVGGGIDVLVWLPLVSPGGGLRLLMSLLPALAAAPGIRSVRLAVPRWTVSVDEARQLLEHGVVVLPMAPGQQREGRGRSWFLTDREVVYGIDGDDEWVAQTVGELGRGCDVLFSPWPHRCRFPEVGLPVVCTVQDTTLVDYPEGLGPVDAALERERMGTWVARSDAVVVSSESTRANLTRLYGALGTKVELIHHAILPRPEVGEDVLPPEVEARLPERFVLSAGNISPHKNLDLLLHAWARWPRRREWPLVVIGHGTDAVAGVEASETEGWRRTQVAGLAARLGLHDGDGVVPLGFVPDSWVPTLMGRAAALVMPSFTEGGGSFPVEEALSNGVPVLCSDIPVMREHLAHRSAGATWFDPWSVDSIVAAAEALVADYPARLRAARTGRLDPRPGWDVVAGAYAEVLVGAAARGGVVLGA